MNIFTKNLSNELWSDFEKYFEFNGKCSGCWCMNHYEELGFTKIDKDFGSHAEYYYPMKKDFVKVGS